ncbi:type VII secretion system-associated protein [Streptomyces hyaluromycini]|uniref:Type VII secretion system-associated protein n=1 Tax=Streptomyces hyaluromycini TaxID=1377993 RepID=A0ABV1X2P5_9ACTN
MADLTKLDAQGLQAFIDKDVTGFYNDIVALRRPGQTPPALFDVGNEPKPLLLGQMNSDGDTGGDTVLKNARTAATAIDKVLNNHQSGFQDLRTELENVITTMLKTQGDNLADVDAQKFLSAIDGYVSDMGGGSNSTTTKTS